MKYKINYKSNDSVYYLNKINEFMKSQGYTYKRHDHPHVLYTREDFDNPEEIINFEINYENKYIIKYITNKAAGDHWDISFTTDELKFFDLLDYEVESVYKGDVVSQDITDWVEES